MRLVIISALILLQTAWVAGQVVTDTIDISTTRIPLKSSETGRSITVITSEELEKLPASSIDEVLQTVTGVEIQSRNGFGVQADILMRGSTFTQVLILIDGMKMNDPLTGHFNGYIPVVKEEIERIEVLRGAASAIYGADAVGGVINIITKVFSNRAHPDSHGASASGGAFSTVDLQAGSFMANDDWRVGGGISYLRSDGQTLPSIDNSDTYENFFEVRSIGLSAAKKLSDRYSLKFRSSGDLRDFSARYFYTTSPFDKSTERVGNFWNRLTLEFVDNNKSEDFNVAYKRNTDEFVFSPDFPSTNNHLTQLINFSYNRMHILSEDFIFKTGAQIDRRSIVSNDRGDHADMHYGAYVMGSWHTGRLHSTLSLRADHDDNYGLQFSPSLNLSYVLPKLVLRASGGRSIRAADYTERYVSNNLTDLTPGRSLGNPLLNSESSWSQEIGADLQLGHNLSLSTTFFNRSSAQLIDYVSTPAAEIGSVSEIGSLQPDGDYFFAQNISEVQTAGVEIQAALATLLAGHQLRWTTGYTYTNTSSEEDVISVYISSHARHLATTRLSLDLGFVDISVTGLYKHRLQTLSAGSFELEPSYQVWNTKLRVPIKNQLGVHLDLRNVFDEQYQNILGARMPGRWWMVGLHWNP